ncbi:hypothetical protein C8J56DRAFT_890729 [Mycena floridula]|nr:hypothetical protein C8J56DRAFT_890729 [Mycena floridula]
MVAFTANVMLAGTLLSVQGVFANPSLLTSRRVVARDSSNDSFVDFPFPTQCQSKCSVIDTFKNQCSSPADASAADALTKGLQCLASICTQPSANQFAGCLDCALAYNTTLSLGTAQTTMDDFTTGCTELGLNVSNITLAPTKNLAAHSFALSATGVMALVMTLVAGALVV